MKQLDEFIKIFNSLGRYQDIAEAFEVFLDHCLLPQKKGVLPQEIEECMKKIHHPEGEFLFMELKNILIDVKAKKDCYDLLGDFFMDSISRGHNGQFFTPDEIGNILARINIPQDAKLGEKVLDPACGSGRLLMAAHRRCRHLLLFGADTSRICCKMALLNMLMYGMIGEISHMNSLSNEFFEAYIIYVEQEGHLLIPYYIHTIDPQRSFIRLKTKTEWKEYWAKRKDCYEKMLHPI
ncbi:type I restriction enzyme M protein [Chitinophaga sp. YR573]|uniref:N-6 DNA methylase n=1 Tax=Chitinophaga sp. YR573 TaxID=1881040 RepID=UPI0008CF2132|nr:N-6 DNA methylase [Chitinophaga sp. YR573]SEW20883.1 type I restriction enzyme M protein [Chitinophaga sp. YR573]